MYNYPCQVLKVIDGDTLKLVIDLGFSITLTTTVRLQGINCPEMNTVEGKAAKAFAMEWVANRVSFTVKTFKDKQEKYGRYLAELYDQDGICCLNADLVMNDHAVRKQYFLDFE